VKHRSTNTVSPCSKKHGLSPIYTGLLSLSLKLGDNIFVAGLSRSWHIEGKDDGFALFHPHFVLPIGALHRFCPAFTPGCRLPISVSAVPSALGRPIAREATGLDIVDVVLQNTLETGHCQGDREN
jgi:hypothetical protein